MSDLISRQMIMDYLREQQAQADKYFDGRDSSEEKMECCPLRKLPEKHNTDARQIGEQGALFNQGWNACLDAIDRSGANE